MNSNNFNTKGLNNAISLGDNGTLIKSIDSNNGIAFKSNDDGKYVVCRGARAVGQHDFITKGQLDSDFRYINTTLNTNGTTQIDIGHEDDIAMRIEYTFTDAYIYSQFGTLTLLKSANNISVDIVSHEFSYNGTEQDNITFTCEIIDTRIFLNILNVTNTVYTMMLAPSSFNKNKLTPSMTPEAIALGVWISNLEKASALHPDSSFVILEDGNDDYKKKRMKLSDLQEYLNGNLSIHTLPVSELGINDCIVIESASNNYQKRRVNIQDLVITKNDEMYSYYSIIPLITYGDFTWTGEHLTLTHNKNNTKFITKIRKITDGQILIINEINVTPNTITFDFTDIKTDLDNNCEIVIQFI